MAGGQITQRPLTSRATLVALVMTALCQVVPATASFNAVSACSDITDAKLGLSATDLKKAVLPPEVDAVDNKESDGDGVAERIATTRFLSPGTKAAPLANEHKRPAMNARVPGLSDEALSRYKRQMYRKDI